jgi:hypothetical protein
MTPDARAAAERVVDCPCPCHGRVYAGIWAHDSSCLDCGTDHVVGAKYGPPRCPGTTTILHHCEREAAHDGLHRTVWVAWEASDG